MPQEVDEVSLDLSETASKGSGGGHAVPARVRPDRKLLSLILIYLTVSVDLLGVFILIPILPFLVGAQEHDDSFTKEDMAGLSPGVAMACMMMSFNFAQLFSILAFGPLSDRFGRKFMLLVSLLGSVVGYSLSGVAIALGNFYLLLAMRVLTGLLGGSRPVAVAFIADSAPPEQRAKLLGLLAIVASVSMQIGPLLGGSLGALGLSVPCFAAAGIAVSALLPVWTLLIEPQPQGKATKSGTTSSDSKLDKVALVLNGILSFSVGFWIAAKILGFSLLLPERFDFDTNKVGLSAMGDGIMILIGNPVYLLLIKRIPIPLVAALGCLLMSLVVICPHLELAPLLVVRYVSCLGEPLTLPAASAVVTLMAPPHRRGLLAGLTLAAQSFGRSMSPMINGAAFDEDDSLPFLIGSCVIFVGMIASLLLVPRMPRPGAKPKSAPHPEAAKDDAEAQHDEDETMKKNVEGFVLRLREHQEKVRRRLESLEGTYQDVSVDYEGITPEVKVKAQKEISDWFVQLLEHNGYKAWSLRLYFLKLVLFNSFPPVRQTSLAEKLEDILHMYENHIAMAERTDYFKGSEDLMQAFL